MQEKIEKLKELKGKAEEAQRNFNELFSEFISLYNEVEKELGSCIYYPDVECKIGKPCNFGSCELEPDSLDEEGDE